MLFICESVCACVLKGRGFGSHRYLASCYLNGHEVAQDRQKASALFQVSCAPRCMSPRSTLAHTHAHDSHVTGGCAQGACGLGIRVVPDIFQGRGSRERVAALAKARSAGRTCRGEAVAQEIVFRVGSRQDAHRNQVTSGPWPAGCEKIDDTSKHDATRTPV